MIMAGMIQRGDALNLFAKPHNQEIFFLTLHLWNVLHLVYCLSEGLQIILLFFSFLFFPAGSWGKYFRVILLRRLFVGNAYGFISFWPSFFSMILLRSPLDWRTDLESFRTVQEFVLCPMNW